jgi:uncharacterized protein (DUF305 family)
MKNKLLFWFTICALSLAPVAIVSGVEAQMNMGSSSMNMGTKAMDSLEKLSGKQFDIAWMSQMIQHHKGALEMAQKCVKTCNEPDVQKAAQTIINAQTREIKQMTGWLKTWYGVVPDKNQMALMRQDMKSMMDSSMTGMVSMDGMAHADKAFLEGMIPHHQGAVDMAKLALTKAAKPELKKFAQQVITDQSKEIKQFQTWLKKM